MFDQENDIAMISICSEIIHTEKKLAIMYELLSAAFWAVGQIHVRISSVLEVWPPSPPAPCVIKLGLFKEQVLN